MNVKSCPDCGKPAVRVAEKLPIGIRFEIRCSECPKKIETYTLTGQALRERWNSLS